MNKKLNLLFCMILYFFCFRSFAQSPVSVNPLTGTANVVIPIYSLSSGQVSLPINLVYSTNGVKPKDVESTAGMGWQLDCGGQISRVVRGIPDDCTYDNASNFSTGWISSVDVPYVNSFTPANVGTCTTETTDISYINNYLPPGNEDTEPDIFYVSAPGLSCQLVYDRSTSMFQPVTYQDLVISYTTIGGTGNIASLINSFTITNDKGIKYVFAAPETVTQTTTSGTNANYFKTKYTQYKNGVTYYDGWNLTSITDANGNGILLSYSAAAARSSKDPVSLYLGGSTISSLQYYVQQSVTPQVLTSISTTNVNHTTNCFTLSWNTYPGSQQTGQTVILSIIGMDRDFQFNYSQMIYTPTGFQRFFLRSFTDPGCSTPVNYQFNYKGESVSAYTTTLPDSSSTNIDYWGYYSTHPAGGFLGPSVYVNPSNGAYQRYAIKVPASPGSSYTYTLTNTDRSADTAVVATGALTKITYVQGGSTTINYQSNDYLDVPSGNTLVYGGGIRVKQVIDSVSTSSANNIVRNYSYVNKSTGVSSGKPVTLPAYAFTIPYSGSLSSQSLTTTATAISGYDLSTEDHTIMYTNTTVSQTGAGSTYFQYFVPATNWDASAAPDCSSCTTEWYPTTDYAARVTCSTQTVKNDIYSYPFIPNPNYDFERGVLQKIINYNDANSEVSEADYTYVRAYTPLTMSAFKAEDNNTISYSVKAYNKYIIYYRAAELTASVNKIVYDSSNSGTSQSSTVTYTYGSSNHRLLTQQSATNSDNSIVNSYFTYTKDLTTASGSSTNDKIKAIYNLQQQNINIPVETYQKVTRGSTTSTTGASLSFFRDTTMASVNRVIPSSQSKWIQPDGGSFTPMSISGNILTSDAGYFTVANYDIYDNTGFPRTVDDNNKHIQTTVLDHYSGQPTAVFKNAAYNQVAFSDFDTDPTSPPSCGFTITGSGSYTPVGSHAGNAAGLYAVTQTAASGTLTKNALAQNYIFSVWINATTGGTLTLTLSGFTTHPSFTYTTGGWKYYELKIPVGTLSSSYTVSFTAGTSISIDDVLFYPDVAEVSTATYDATAHYKIAQTNTNGVSAYFTNDQWGRVLYAFDQDHNIVQKNTYLSPADISTYASPAIAAANPYNGQPTSFSIIGPDACAAAGTTVTWHFGDGTTATTAGLVSPSHTYTGLGTVDTVKATVNSPLFGTKTPAPVVVTVQPILIPLTYTTFTLGHGDISSVVFKQGGVTVYSFTGSQLNTSHVLQGSYSIVVTLSDGQQYNSGTQIGYGSVNLSNACNSWCAVYASSNIYTFTVDLSNCASLDFSVYEYNFCGS